MTDLADTIERQVYEAVVAAAQKGERCPVASAFLQAGISKSSATLTALARRGVLRVEIGGRNWRVVEFLGNEHRGLRTAEPSYLFAPYIIIDSRGIHYL